jgi:hypothetical protein
MPSATRRTVQLGTLELVEEPVTALPTHPADAAEVLTMRIPVTVVACRATSIAECHATSRRAEVRCIPATSAVQYMHMGGLDR